MMLGLNWNTVNCNAQHTLNIKMIKYFKTARFQYLLEVTGRKKHFRAV